MKYPREALAFAISIARKAGNIQRSRFRKKLTVSMKAQRNIVTDVDHQCESLIISAVRKNFPDHGFLAEEGSRRHAEFLWVVDPLDGTTNFSRGIPSFCVSIALVHGEKPVVGVIYEPLLDQMFYASLGHGAFLNKKRMYVSPIRRLDQSVLTTGFPYRLDHNKNLFGIIGRLIRKTFAVRRPGAAALDLAFVAAGFTDGHFEFRLHPWDVAAGALLIEEAGGKVTLPQNSIFHVQEDFLIASNGRIHDKIRKAIQGK